jgi:GntR family transcriptional repressor for pyruvate dehydrogenase complex
VKRMQIASAARQAADALGDEILGHDGDETEWSLGSENDLMELLGIGRPTLRQAARLLEQQQLLVVKRGINGGFFGRRPSAEGITANARVFLRSQQTSFADLLRAELILGPACAELAAVNPDETQRAALMSYYDPWESGDLIPLRTYMDLAPGFQREVARLSGSPTLFLFVSVLMDLAGHAGGIADVYDDPNRRRLTVERHREIAKAINAGRAAVAAKRMTHHLESIIEWCDERALSQTLEPHQR